jgi:hypothetical protein
MSDIEEVELKPEEGNTEVTDVNEQVARAQGWKPKEEFLAAGGEESKWVAHDEFNRRKEFFDAIHKANQRTKRVEEQLNALSEHHKRVAEVEREKARKELMQEKFQAAKDNDLERVVAVDVELEALNKTPVPTTPKTTNPDLEAFVTKNRWYAEDEDLQAYANGIGARLERDNPEMLISEVLRLVEDKVKKTFPHKFRDSQPVPQTVPSVMPSRSGPSGPATSRKKRITYNDLDDDARAIYNKLVKNPKTNPRGTMTGEQYLKEYASITNQPWEE